MSSPKIIPDGMGNFELAPGVTDVAGLLGDLLAQNFGSLVNSGATLRENLLVEYDLTEGSGSVLNDSSGNGNNATFPGGSQNPTWIGNTGGLLFNRSDSQHVKMPSVMNGLVTLYLVCGFNANDNLGQFSCPFGGDTTGSQWSLLYANNLAYSAGLGNPPRTMAVLWTQSPFSSGRVQASMNGLHIITVVLGVSTCTIYVDGVPVAGNSIIVPPDGLIGVQDAGNFWLGGDGVNPTGNYFNDSIFYVSGYSAAHTQAEIFANVAILKQNLAARGLQLGPFNQSLDNQVTFDGDSLSIIFDPFQVDLTLVGTPQVVVLAVGGSQIIADLIPNGGNIDVYRSGGYQQWLSVWAGTNDIFSAAISPAQTHAALASYCRQRKAAGWMVAVSTCISRDGSGGDANKNAYNTLIRANYKQYADFLIDIAAEPLLGADGASSNTTYFQVDEIHYTVAGEALVTALYNNVMNRMLGNLDFSSANKYTASATAALVDTYAVLGASAGSQTYTLQPAKGYTGGKIFIKNTDTHSWTIASAGSETIDGAATLELAAGSTLIIESVLVSASAGGNNWLVESNS